MNANNKVTITICGDGGCGKSSITLRLVRSQWTSEYDPTIEDSYSVTRVIDGQTYNLLLTDTAGQEEYRGLWAASNLKSDAFLLVYDITNPDSLNALNHFTTLIEMEEEGRIDRNECAPIKIVAGNKCDLQGSRLVTSQQGLEWARSRGCGFMETSAREMVNIEETFALIVRRVVEGRRLKAQQQASLAAAQQTRKDSKFRGQHVEKPLPKVGTLTGSTSMERRKASQPSVRIMPEAHEVLGEKGSFSDTDSIRRGGGGFWSKLRCW